MKFRNFFEWRVGRYNPQFQLNRESELYLFSGAAARAFDQAPPVSVPDRDEHLGSESFRYSIPRVIPAIRYGRRASAPGHGLHGGDFALRSHMRVNKPPYILHWFYKN